MVLIHGHGENFVSSVNRIGCLNLNCASTLNKECLTPSRSSVVCFGDACVVWSQAWGLFHNDLKSKIRWTCVTTQGQVGVGKRNARWLETITPPTAILCMGSSSDLIFAGSFERRLVLEPHVSSYALLFHVTLWYHTWVLHPTMRRLQLLVDIV